VRLPSLLVLALCAAQTLIAGADEFPCAGTRIVVVAKSKYDYEGICLAARNSLAFLASIGLALDTRTTIRISDHFGCEGCNHTIGQFDPRSGEIKLLSYEAALMASYERPAFRVAMSRPLWHSYVSHELAHAASLRHFALGVQTFTATEYIAAVVQLATLAPTMRNDILRNYSDVAAYDNEVAISHLYYLMNPCMFAVKAYLHYLKPENGPKFIDRLIHQGLPN